MRQNRLTSPVPPHRMQILLSTYRMLGRSLLSTNPDRPQSFRKHFRARDFSRALSGGRYWVRTSDLFRVREARYRCANRPRLRGGYGIRTRVHGFAGRCLASRPTHRVKPFQASRSGRRDSNPRPSPWQGDALPTELRPRYLSGFPAVLNKYSQDPVRMSNWQSVGSITKFSAILPSVYLARTN